MLVTIGGKRWNMVFSPDSWNDGSCDPPTKKNKRITLPPRLKKNPQRLLEVVIHESLHASDWSKAEDEWVKPIAEDIARILWKMGFRLTEPREL